MQDDQENTWADWYKIITIAEKTLLVIIAFLTAYAVLVEIVVILAERAVKLTDLLLLFIYAEVLFGKAIFNFNSKGFKCRFKYTQWRLPKSFC